MAQKSKDLFDDSTMSFGEHLEVLRYHLWKAILGASIGVVVCLIYGQAIVGIVRQPVDDALKVVSEEKRKLEIEDDVAGLEEKSFWESVREAWGFESSEADEKPAVDEDEGPINEIVVDINAHELMTALNAISPEQFAEPGDELREMSVPLTLKSPVFAKIKAELRQSLEPITLNVQEAFMTYLKVSLIAGLVLSSPWVFYQIWQFVAAGLYPHERKYVYIYGGMSLLLFLVGVVFCFYGVFPFVLKFLLKFNLMMQITPQIRLSEWISFAVLLPLMFGIGFQLPLVMRFLNAISIFDAEAYRSKRRLAVLVIAFLSMVLTPADPMSMLMMMFPLIILYEFGILLCKYSGSRSPFETA